RDACRSLSDLDRLAHVVRLRVDARDGVGVRVRGPDRAVARRDPARRRTDGDLRCDLAALRIDQADRVGGDLAGGAGGAPPALNHEYADYQSHQDDSGGRGDQDQPALSPPRADQALDGILSSFGKLALASLEGRGGGSLQRREHLSQPGRDELVDALRLVQILQLMLAEIAQRDVREWI